MDKGLMFFTVLILLVIFCGVIYILYYWGFGESIGTLFEKPGE